MVGDLPLMLVPLGDGPLDAASRDASRLRRLRLARNLHALRATNTASQPGASHFWRLEIGASGMVSTNPVRHATGVGLWSRRLEMLIEGVNVLSAAAVCRGTGPGCHTSSHDQLPSCEDGIDGPPRRSKIVEGGRR